jgi:hypothetical protein
MKYQLALDPEIGLSAGDFAAAWNASAECQQAAQALLVSPPSVGYDPAALAAAQVVLETLLLGVASSALYDMIKALFVRKGIRRKIEIHEVTQANGTHILVVSIVEEE